jgi:hypothetical protein
MKEVCQDLEVKHGYCGDAITLPLLNTTFSRGHDFPFKEAISNSMWYGTRMGGQAQQGETSSGNLLL